MSFARVTRLALQPSVLALDPTVARAQFVRDLDRRGLAAGGPKVDPAYQGMLRGILREQALATYDREAPRLREADRAPLGW